MSNRNAKWAGALPSLDLLRGFEAAARNLSFTRAGEDLSITQSAVSRQIQALEERLGVPLFRRRHRALLLTEEGQRLYRAVAEALERIRRAVEQVADAAGGRQVSVSTSVGFASLWLIPRLAGFRETCPGVDVRVSATNVMVNLERERVDLAIRYCPPDLVPRGAVKLFDEDVYPVCSPRLLRNSKRPLVAPTDLRRHVLIHYDDPGVGRWPFSWDAWLEAEGIADLEPAGVLRFTQYDQAIQAAVEGQGVALGRSPLVQNLVRAKKLVVPLARTSASARSHYVVESKNVAGRPEVQAFLQWLQAQAERDRRWERASRARKHAAR